MTTTPGIHTTGGMAQADEVFYPETDGMPLPDGPQQEPYYRETVSLLELHLDSPTTFVSGNTFIYYVEGNPRRSIAPDCYVTFGISKESIERYNTYRVWAVGKMPDFVLEIGSVSTASNDKGPKRDLYASLGVSEYWRFDPTGREHYGEPLVGEYLADETYHRFAVTSEPEEVRGHSPILGLDLCWQEGRLRFYDPATGRWLENLAETAARAEQEAARVQQETARAGREAARAEQEAARAEQEAARAEREAARAETETARAEHAEEQVRILQQRIRELGHTNE